MRTNVWLYIDCVPIKHIFAMMEPNGNSWKLQRANIFLFRLKLMLTLSSYPPPPFRKSTQSESLSAKDWKFQYRIKNTFHWMKNDDEAGNESFVSASAGIAGTWKFKIVIKIVIRRNSHDSKYSKNTFWCYCLQTPVNMQIFSSNVLSF